MCSDRFRFPLVSSLSCTCLTVGCMLRKCDVIAMLQLQEVTRHAAAALAQAAPQPAAKGGRKDAGAAPKWNVHPTTSMKASTSTGFKTLPLQRQGSSANHLVLQSSRKGC